MTLSHSQQCDVNIQDETEKKALQIVVGEETLNNAQENVVHLKAGNSF